MRNARGRGHDASVVNQTFVNMLLRRWLVPLLPVLVLALMLWVLHDAMAGYHLRDVMRQVRSLTTPTLVLAALASLLSYALLSGYDFLALRYLRQRIHWLRTLITSFCAFAVGHNVGLVSLSGGAIRLRMYGAVGLPAADVAVISGFCVFTTLLGSLLLMAIGLGWQGHLAAALLHLPERFTPALSALLWLVLLGIGVFASRQRAPLRWRNWSFSMPSLRMLIAQTSIAALDLVIAAACLYVLLPLNAANAQAISFPAFISVFVLSQAAVLISNVPGGLGVLETVIVLALPGLPTSQVVGALLMYRVIYYLLPLLMSALLLLGHETWQQRQRVARVAGTARDWLSAVAPLAMGTLVLLAGVVLLLSGATPGIAHRLQGLNELVPLPVLELSHLLGSIIGLGLLVLSRALMRRVARAWRVALWLLAAGAVMSLLKGFDYEEAIIMLMVAGVLYLSRPAFYRQAALIESHLNLRWLAGLSMIVAIIIWVGLLSHRHVQYSHELWWTFALHGDAPRMLRASVVVALLGAAVVAHSWLTPRAPRQLGDDTATRTTAQAIATDNAHAADKLALLNDKRYLLHPAGDAFLMYQVAGRSWIAMGDPARSRNAPNSRATELAWSFRELSDEYDGWTVFYQVRPELLPLYVDLGLALLKLGEEARMPLTQFNLEGKARAEFRTTRRRAEREGARFEVRLPPHDDVLLDQLARVSQHWLNLKAANEKRFSVGFFDRSYLQHMPLALVWRQDELAAFANLWTTSNCHEVSVDLMRYGANAPYGVMDYLFIEAMLWSQAQGYEWFNLGMAPLSGLEQHYLAPAWHRFGNFVFDIGEHFYNFEGLRRYKEKFQPIWEPRYLAAPGGLTLPLVLLDVASVIAGGKREILFKRKQAQSSGGSDL